MMQRDIRNWALAAVVASTVMSGGPSWAGGGHSHWGGGGGGGGFASHHHHMGPGPILVGGGGGVFPIVVPQPQILVQPLLPVFMPTYRPSILAGPMPVAARRPVVAMPARVRKVTTTKGDQLVTIGDRLFRAGNVKRAAERYDQAARTDPDAPMPHVRLSQVAFVRGQYAEAAQQLRQAVSAQPDWVVNARDIQSLYGEPADFRKQIAKLESHLLNEPADRDGWLVLGAELFLSGQTRRAGDVFLRLTDRRPDATLAAFLDAANASDSAAH